MRVAMYYNNKDIRIEEMPIPKISADELLVKVMACGICGSDVMEWYRIKKAPLVLGHEVTGIVEKVGENIKNYKKGDRVFVSHHVPCNTCKYCLSGNHTVCDTLRTTNFYPGGFSEYIQVPAINVQYGVYKLPDEISFEEGTFIEPLGCVVRAQRIAKVEKNQSVLVLGSGIAGLLNIKLARALGAKKIVATDINDYRLKAALRADADAVINAKEDVSKRVREANENELADRVIVCTSAMSAIEQALKCADRGGIVLFFAPTEPRITIQLSLWDVWHDQITVMHSYAAAPQDIIEAIQIISTKKIEVKDLITHKLSMAETAKGFELVYKAQNSIKVIIEPQR
ncbi:MAG: zinc-dependent dehydrogenase [Candidatus Thermoplasmatota archaeon]|nr:zinc-dependent dehydrogenase [Candidatus Thermoplasmatota archaeon]